MLPPRLCTEIEKKMVLGIVFFFNFCAQVWAQAMVPKDRTNDTERICLMVVEARAFIFQTLSLHFGSLVAHSGSHGASFVRLGGFFGPSWPSRPIMQGIPGGQIIYNGIRFDAPKHCESGRGKLENHQGVCEPRGREDCGAGKLLYHLRGYSELLQ